MVWIRISTYGFDLEFSAVATSAVSPAPVVASDTIVVVTAVVAVAPAPCHWCQLCPW